MGLFPSAGLASGHVALAAANFVPVILIEGQLRERLGGRGFALPAMQRRSGWLCNRQRDR